MKVVLAGQQMDTLKSTLQENQRQNCQRMDNLESTLQENQRQNFEQREVTATLASNIQQKGQKIEVLDSEIKQLQLQASDQKVTTDNLASDVQQQEERIAEIQSATRSRQTGILAWIRCCTNPQQPGITQGKGKLRQDLVKIYHKEEECISVSPLDDQNLTLEQIYSPVIVEEDLSKEGTKPRKSGNQQIKKTEDIFYNNGKLVERVFMKGEAGKGKTVFGIKLLHDWCRIQEGFYGCDMHKVLSLFELTFFVSLRHVKQGITNIVDMICDSLPSKHSDVIRHVLSDENTRCLIILDGLDEWSCPSHYDDKFPDSRDLDNCVLFNTTRPWKLEKLRLKYTSLDKVVEIQGLNPKCIKNVIKRVVTYLYDKHDTDKDSDNDDEISQATSRTDRDNLQETDIDDSELNIESDSDDDSEISSDSKSDGNIHVNFQNITRRVFRKFIKNPRERAKKIDVTFPEDFRRRLNVFIKKVRSPSMESLMSIPMMLTASCHVWYENNKKKRGKKKDVMASMTYFSLAIIDILIKRSKSKEDIKHYLQQRKRGSTSTSTTTNMTPLISRFFPNIVDLMEIIMPFCKLAYNDLLAKETHLVFEREHLEREMGDTTVDLALKVGFISQCKAPGSFHVQNVSVSFFHKLIQEIMAAIYIIRCPDGLQTLCDQCPSLDKVLDLSNVFMYVSGLDSSLGCVLSQHVARVTETDHDIALYRQEMREGRDKVRRLYHSHLTCYREMVHVSSMMGIPHPPPDHISDVYLDRPSDSEVVRVTGEIMSYPHHTVVSVRLWWVPDVSGVIRYLPQHSQTLTALRIMYCDIQSGERLVTVLPLLVHLQCVWYGGHNRDVDAGVVAALTRLTRLKYVQLWDITLGNTPLCVSHMTQLETLELVWVYMTAGGWGELVSRLLSIPHKVKVTLYRTDIDADSITRILSSPQVTLIQHHTDSGGRTWYLVFYNKT